MRLILAIFLILSFLNSYAAENESYRRYKNQVAQAIKGKNSSACSQVEEYSADDMMVGKEWAVDGCLDRYAQVHLDIDACKKIKEKGNRELCLEIIEKVKLVVAAKDIKLCDKYFNKGSPRWGICTSAFKK